MTIPPTPNVLPSSTITISEADVLAFFAAASERLKRETGETYTAVELTFRDGKPDWATYVDRGSYLHGATCEAAIAAQVYARSPEARKQEAARLRAQAAALESMPPPTLAG